MRRTVGLIGVAVLLLAAGPAGAMPEPGGDGGGGQEAFAAWIFLTSRDGGIFYFADAYRFAGAPDGVVAEGLVGKGQCVVTRTKDMTIIVCLATGRAQAVSLDQFQMDPVLRSASLDMKVRHHAQHVRWTGLGDGPAVWSGEFAAPGMAGIQAGADRGAAARGTLFGTRLGRGGLPFAFLSTSAGADVYASPNASLRRWFTGEGAERLRYEGRIPR